jgi:hypothetical protein
MENGWIKLHRKFLECGFFNNPDLAHFWVWCILKATHQEFKASIGYQIVILQPGQFIYGRKVASIETGLSEQTLRTCIKHLENIENLTIKSTNKYSIITITNWDTYQNTEAITNHQTNQQVTSNQPAGNQQVTTYKNNKNNKKVKNIRKYVVDAPPKIEDVNKYCQERDNGIDPQGFIDTNTSVGWKDKNGNFYVDWKAVVRKWENFRKATKTITVPLKPIKRPISIVVLEMIAAGKNNHDILHELVGIYSEHDINEALIHSQGNQGRRI